MYRYQTMRCVYMLNKCFKSSSRTGQSNGSHETYDIGKYGPKIYISYTRGLNFSRFEFRHGWWEFV